jgi:hypothetical protein
MQRGIGKALLIMVIGFLSLPSLCSAKVQSIESCKRVVSEIQTSEYPKRGKAFVQYAPECSLEKGGVVLVFKVVANKVENVSSSYYDSMIGSVAEASTAGLCDSKDLGFLIELVDLRFDYYVDGESSPRKNLAVTQEICNKKKTFQAPPAAVRSVEQMDLATCQLAAQSAKKQLPQKLNDVTIRYDVECRTGTSKKSSIVYRHELLVTGDLELAKRNILSPVARSQVVRNTCVNEGGRNLLRMADTVYSFKIGTEIVREILIQESDCQ